MKLDDGTLIEADPNRPYTRFLKIMTGPVVVRISLTGAEALYQMLGEYFAQPDVIAAHGDLAHATGELV